jgi:putative transposase
MILARKIRLEVTPSAAAVLDGQSKIANWLYNHLLEKANHFRVEYRAIQDTAVGLMLYSRRGLRDLIPELKQEYPFLKSVYSSPLKNAALRLSRAIGEYQKSRRGERDGGQANWPAFRSWGRDWFSLEYDEPWKGYSLEGRSLKLNLGVDLTGKRLSVSGQLSEALPKGEKALVKGLRIIKEAGEFFAIFTIEKEVIKGKENPQPMVIALDPNHKNLAYGVGTDGRAIEIINVSHLRRLDERIDSLKSRRDNCQKRSKLVEQVREDGSVNRHWEPSRRWQFFNQLLEKAYQERREQTKTFLYTVAHRLCRDYEIIGVGDYAPHGGGISSAMRRAMNNRSLIGRFKDVVAWVAVRAGRLYIEYEEKGTTRTCHLPDCGYQVEGGLDPNVREWKCPGCQRLHIRDENAAQNGLIRTLEKLNMPCSGHTPVEIQVRWAWEVMPSGVKELRGGVAVQAML